MIKTRRPRYHCQNLNRSDHSGTRMLNGGYRIDFTDILFYGSWNYRNPFLRIYHLGTITDLWGLDDFLMDLWGLVDLLMDLWGLVAESLLMGPNWKKTRGSSDGEQQTDRNRVFKIVDAIPIELNIVIVIISVYVVRFLGWLKSLRDSWTSFDLIETKKVSQALTFRRLLLTGRLRFSEFSEFYSSCLTETDR